MTPRPFLPFTANGKATELTAIAVKQRLGLGPQAAVDPFQVLPQVPARLFDADELRRHSPVLACALFTEHANAWDAVGLGNIGAEGEALILLNPTPAATRQRASLMEEVVHIVLDHPKTVLTGMTPDIGATAWTRPYDPAVEDEAYNVGAACLLPYPALFDAVNRRHEHANVIATRSGVSVDHAMYRIKRAGLSRIYNKHCV
jgi:IrrE N-terminal-like domain